MQDSCIHAVSFDVPARGILIASQTKAVHAHAYVWGQHAGRNMCRGMRCLSQWFCMPDDTWIHFRIGLAESQIKVESRGNTEEASWKWVIAGGFEIQLGGLVDVHRCLRVIWHRPRLSPSTLTCQHSLDM